MTAPTLRPDQSALKAAVYNGWQAGARNMLAVAVTGFGKSVVTSDIVNDMNMQRYNQVVIAHRQELVGQMSLHVARRGIQHRIIGPKNVVSEITAEHRREFGRSFLNPSAQCSVAGVDTLIARADELQHWARQIGFWTIDEAHHVLRENKWGKAAAMFPNAYGLGVTATPQRADGCGLGSHADGIFDAMELGPSMRETIDAGNLCDYQLVVPSSDFSIDETALAPSGDFSTARMKEASEKSHIVGDVVVEYCRWAFGKRGITFATDVETANKIAAQFNLFGIPAAAVSAKTPSNIRSEYIRRFRDGRLWQLVNVDLFGEGFDVPAVEVVSMARPTASLGVYLQQFGRALRLMAGKPYGLVIDHVSNYKRHGLPDKSRAWTLDRRPKRGKSVPDPDAIELTPCKSCSRPYEKCLTACPHCGAVPPLPEPGAGGRTVEQVDGDLRLLDAATLATMRKATELISPAAAANRAGFAHGAGAAAGQLNRQMERIQAQDRLKEAIAVWFGLRRAAGDTDAVSEKRFYLTLGCSTLDALAMVRADMERIAETVEGWCNG